MKRLRCDVVVVGCGAAGLTAAMAALEEGASVIVLERAPREERGGNTRWTEALLRMTDDGEVRDDFVPNLIANAGYHIAPEFVQATVGDYDSWPGILKSLPFTDPELLSMFAEGAPEVLKWLAPHGIRIHPSMYPLVPAMGAKMPGIYGGGLAIIEALCPAIERQGGTFLYDTTAVKLLEDEDNRIVGVKATDRDNASIYIDAKSVVLASGGFEGNQAMVVQYMGPNARYMRPVARGGWYNKGEGIRMALSVNAAPAGDYAECHRQPIDPRSSVSEALVHAYPLGIVVNAKGDRFMDEAPNERGGYLEPPLRAINGQPGGIAYFIFDKQIEHTPNWRVMIRSDQAPIEAGSIAELGQKLAIPVDRLEATVETFNRACDGAPVETGLFDGRCTAGIHPPKSNWARAVTQPPFRCYPIIASNTFTFGGLKVTRDAQVVSTSGAVIRGLYAAGETVGILYGEYVGATSVLRGLVFGRQAGKHAGRQAASSTHRS
ncbi:FAD-dependent oxidoreductase [Tardiphaga sp. 215_C5_N2_1]|uniref:FAD-dependent oxidoreductase n=1 Tax=Tardiphaga sp. 215_C5_N2_1 TaxID=3240774 RepID=UPI003F8C89D2